MFWYATQFQERLGILLTTRDVAVVKAQIEVRKGRNVALKKLRKSVMHRVIQTIR
jgi:hypothetical protein